MQVIAIDGPSSSGKSTVAKLVASKLNFVYFNSGLVYRTVAHIAYVEDKNRIDDFDFILKLLDEYQLKYIDGDIYINDHLATKEVRNDIYTEFLPRLTAHPMIRDYVNVILRDAAKHSNLTVDGRDIGTVVFPDAVLKIYLDADVNVRAMRRYEEVKDEGFTYEEILSRLIKRDELDSNRAVAPLKRADDAIVIDSTNFTIEEIVDQICSLYNEVK